MDYQFTITENPSQELQQAIAAPLIAFNIDNSGETYQRLFAIPLRDNNNKVIGGLYGRIAYQWLSVKLLVVPEHLRGRGIGRRLMQMAEEEALKCGCHSSLLDTFGFQARPFYQKLGYEVFAELPDFPTGSTRYYMKKSLESEG